MLMARNVERQWVDLPSQHEPYKFIESVPVLRLNMYTLAKIDYLIRSRDTEIGGFLVSSKDDPLAIVDFALVEQRSSFASVKFTENGIADYYAKMSEQGYQPDQCARIWAHTHPAMPATPSSGSSSDETTFRESFCNVGVPGCCPPWAGMFIRSATGDNYFRIAYNPPGGIPIQFVCPVVVDPAIPFNKYDPELWEAEASELITKISISRSSSKTAIHYSDHGAAWSDRNEDLGRLPAHYLAGLDLKDDDDNQNYNPRRTDIEDSLDGEYEDNEQEVTKEEIDDAREALRVYGLENVDEMDPNEIIRVRDYMLAVDDDDDLDEFDSELDDDEDDRAGEDEALAVAEDEEAE